MVSILPVSENSDVVLSRNHLLVDNLVKFYESDDNVARVVPIIKKKSTLSLRLIEWFITKHSLDNNLEIESIGNIHMCYKKTLKSYNKRRFDPFRRNERVKLVYANNNKETSVESTIAQLNFFMWLIRTEILDHIVDNITTLTKLAPRGGVSRKKPRLPPVSVSRAVDEKFVNMRVVFE